MQLINSSAGLNNCILDDWEKSSHEQKWFIWNCGSLSFWICVDLKEAWDFTSANKNLELELNRTSHTNSLWVKSSIQTTWEDDVETRSRSSADHGSVSHKSEISSAEAIVLKRVITRFLNGWPQPPVWATVTAASCGHSLHQSLTSLCLLKVNWWWWWVFRRNYKPIRQGNIFDDIQQRSDGLKIYSKGLKGVHIR